jgi:2-iminobutanoate/2-iminopropanoate deaminase
MLDKSLLDRPGMVAYNAIYLILKVLLLGGNMERKAVHSEEAPAAIGPYVQAVSACEFVFCSGQLGLDPTSGQIVEGGIEAQTRQALQNLSAVLKAAGTDLAHVVKTTVFLTDMGNFKAMNEVYATFFADQPPARSTIAVKSLPRDGLVEIEAIAVKP